METNWKQAIDALVESLDTDPEKAQALTAALQEITQAHPGPAQILKMLLDNPESKGARQLLVEQLEMSGLSTELIAGNLVLGTGTTVMGSNNVVLQFLSQFGTDGKYNGNETVDPELALNLYRALLVRRLRHVPLRGLDRRMADATNLDDQPELARIYVELDTTTIPRGGDEEHGENDVEPEQSEPGEEPDEAERPLTALEVLSSDRRTVILGKPGSGKSTLVHHFCLGMALQDIELLPGWPDALGIAVPIRVVLRDLAKFIGEEANEPDLNVFWDFLRRDLAKLRLDFALPHLERACGTDDLGAFVFFDGLDEVPQSQRPLIRDVIELFAERYKSCGISVTCRLLSYKEAWRFSSTYTPHELASFSEAKIDQFIDGWYADLNRLDRLDGRDHRDLAEKLKQGVRRRDLHELAPNPLHLTQMAIVHADGELPDARADLYEKLVDLLLVKWDDARETAERMSTLLDEAKCSKEELLEALRELAFNAHASSGTDKKTADISEQALQDCLRCLHPKRSLDWTERVVESIKQRAGILEERDDHVFGFPHRTFQEHLAGYHLRGLPDFAGEAVRLMDETPDLWREPLLLAAGILLEVTSRPNDVFALVAALLECHDDDRSNTHWRRVWRAGEIMAEVGKIRAVRYPLGRDKLPDVRSALVELIEGGHLEVRERAAAGNGLARLEDPRFTFIDSNGIRIPEISWSDWIEPGTFPMGEGEEQFKCTLIGRRYRIGKFPVTAGQFHCFLDAGGYDDRQWWTKEGWKVVERRNRSNLAGQISNHPVSRITWYEAHAFARWLNFHTPDQEIALPTEAQWERAARHTDARAYPWNGALDDPGQQVNMSQTGLGGTSSVGIFPGGQAECGALDLSGNVREWCLTKWRNTYGNYDAEADDDEEGSYSRVLRGGAFSSRSDIVGCASRYGSNPSNQYWNYGFRVMSCSP